MRDERDDKSLNSAILYGIRGLASVGTKTGMRMGIVRKNPWAAQDKWPAAKVRRRSALLSSETPFSISLSVSLIFSESLCVCECAYVREGERVSRSQTMKVRQRGGKKKKREIERDSSFSFFFSSRFPP